MSKKRLLLWVLIPLFLAAAFLLSPEEKSQQEISEEQAEPLVSLSVSDITGFTIRQGEDMIGVLPTGMSFEVLDDPRPYDTQKLQAFLYSACHLNAVRTLKDPGPLSVYGLEPPVSQISLLTQDAPPVRIGIGDVNPITQERYVSIEGTNAVAMLSSDISDLLAASPEDLLDLRLFPDFSSDPQLIPDTLTLTAGGQTFTLARIAGSVSGLMEMKAPVQSQLDWEAVNNLLMIPLASLIPTRFVSDAPDALEAYGLDTPDAELLLQYANAQLRCVFRFDEQTDLCYCSSSLQPGVCSIPASAAEFLFLSYTDLLGGSLIHPSLVQTERLSISGENFLYSVSFSGTGADLTAFTGNDLLNASSASRFFRQVTSIPVAGMLTEQAVPDAESLLTLTLSYKDGNSDIIEFLPLTASYLAVSVNGTVQFATYGSTPALLVQAFSALQ